MQKIIGIDGAHCKSKLYDRIQPVLVGRDGNTNNVRIATALVPSESELHCSWFLQACIDCGVSFDVPMFSDRGSGLFAAPRTFYLDLKHCTLHTIRNILHRFSKQFRQDHKDYVWNVQKASEQSSYESELLMLGIRCGEAVTAYVAGIDPFKWTEHANVDKV